MSNTIPSELQLTTVLDTALVAFRRAMLPLSAFCMAWSDVFLQGTNKVAVPYYPLATSASQTRASGGSYKALATSTTTQAKEITVNKNKVQAISFTSEERARQPMFNPEMHGRLKGEKLAFDILADIFSPFRHADFTGSTISAVAASNFDENEVADLAQKCMEDYWPETGRSLILNPAFHFNLMKQQQIIGADRSASPENFRTGRIAHSILGFDEYGTAGMPANNGSVVTLVSGEADTEVITATAHGLAVGDRVIFPALTGGSGLTAVTVAYFVKTVPDADTFTVSATPGGSAVNFTTDITAGTVRRYENITGMAVLPSALLVAFAPVEPEAAVRQQLADYRVVKDGETGIVLEYKKIGYADTDEVVEVIEAHYGYALGETAAAKLITASLA